MSVITYVVDGSWQGSREGRGMIKVSGSDTAFSVPESVGGVGIGTSPEELLLSAATSCYLITLGIMLDKRGIPVRDVSIETIGVLTTDPDLRYDRIEHRPILRLQHATADQIDLAHKVLFQAEENCMVSATLRGNVEITVIPKIENE